METLIEAEGNGERGTEESNAEKICASDPVVYQLVRVEGDGRLVPATDDELMEVEHLLEDDKSKLHLVEAKRHTEECPSNEGLSSKKSDLEGPSQSENMEVDSRKLNSRLEYIEVMLQKVKQEERLRLMCESVNRSPKYMVVDGQSSEQPNHSQACDGKLQPENTSMETAPHPTCLNGSHGAQLGSVETCSEPATDAVASRSPVSETCTSLRPDFSILKGEVCLDNLTIRGLQEVFRATFGRQTNVKDKLWLKRRIAMGLTNSCDVPTTSLVIKENRVVQKKVTEAPPCRVQQNMFETGFLPTDLVACSINDNFQNSPNSPTYQIEDQQILSGKKLSKPIMEYDTKNESLQMEQYAAKRIRKPTRRYIEELSEVETRECTGRLISSAKNSGHGQSSPKSQSRPVCDIGSQVTTFVTRWESLGGSGIQIPYVSRVRRGRPRKNFFALMNFPSTKREKKDTETSNSEERDLDPSGDNSDSTADIVPTLKVGAKRKHHRAWTLGEVLKLVEGVARYGAGRWSEIRRLAFASYSYRTSVDLKDKWRNLLRASFAQEPSDKGAKNFRKHASMPIPTPILLRVRELAEMHSQAGVEFEPTKFAGHGGKIVQEKGSGFL